MDPRYMHFGKTDPWYCIGWSHLAEIRSILGFEAHDRLCRAGLEVAPPAPRSSIRSSVGLPALRPVGSGRRPHDEAVAAIIGIDNLRRLKFAGFEVGPKEEILAKHFGPAKETPRASR